MIIQDGPVYHEPHICPDCGAEMIETSANDPRDDSRIECKCSGCGNTHIVYK